MERSMKMKEEDVTKAVLKWLCDNGWKIVCFDFPQSGTGKALHPNGSVSKTEGIIIPDIVATKGNTAVYFENKDRFVLEDCIKVHSIKVSGKYSDAFRLLLGGVFNIFYGIAFPYTDNIEQIIEKHSAMIDFIVCVTTEKECTIVFEKEHCLTV